MEGGCTVHELCIYTNIYIHTQLYIEIYTYINTYKYTYIYIKKAHPVQENIIQSIFLDYELMGFSGMRMRCNILPPPVFWIGRNRCLSLLVQYLTASQLEHSAHCQVSTNTVKGLYSRRVLGGVDGLC